MIATLYKKRIILFLNQIKKSKQIILIDRFDDRLRETSRKLYEKNTQTKKKTIHIEKSDWKRKTNHGKSNF